MIDAFRGGQMALLDGVKGAEKWDRNYVSRLKA
ncbi:hypothetical protein CGLAMM_00150 [Acetobacteraceae bacterium EV16G]